MLLSNIDIIQEMEAGNISISPFDQKFLGPNSYDLHLDSCLKEYTGLCLDPKVKPETKEIHIDDKKGFLLYPGMLLLGQTKEIIFCQNLTFILEGRSSMGRLGLSVHQTGSLGDNGYRGKLTLGLSCIKPTIIYDNLKLAQVFFIYIKTPGKRYQGKYLDTQQPFESHSFLDYKDQ